jgi:RecA/RadA recombinase
MAKKKEDNNPAYIKDLIKKYGNVIVTGAQILEQKKDYKVVTIGPAIDMGLNGGIREGSWLILSGAPKSGKAQPYSCAVQTPSGPVLMSEIVPGSEVCTPEGSRAKVTGIFPQGTIPVYKIIFSDGTYTWASGDHLWKVRKNSPKKDWEIKTTEELEVDLQLQDRNKWMVPVGIAYYDVKATMLPPYLMGVLLADGSLSGKEIRVSTKSPTDKFHNLLKSMGCFLSPHNSIQTIEPNSDNSIKNAIVKYNLNVRRSGKFIPEYHKYNSIEHRKQLLQAIVECNGHYNKTGYIEYTTCSHQLAQDMAEIARSLGIIAKVKPKKNSFRVTFHGDIDGILFHGNKKIKNTYKTIVSIEPDGVDRCQCIKVDSPDELYMTDDYIVTHNTTTAMQLAYNCQQEGRTVIYVNSEGRLSELNFEVDGLDPEKMIIITAEDTPISAEDFLDIVLKLISVKENEGALCIIDSVSSLIPKRDLEGEVSGTTRPGLPKILSDFTKKAGQIVPNNKTIMCLITHLITNISGYGAGKMADGGVKIQFQSDTRMEVKSIAPWEQSDKQVGQAVNWKIYWSGLGATGAECQSWIRYGKGIDKVQELFIIGQEAGLISKAGAWMTCDFLTGHTDLLKEIYPDLDITDAEAVIKACKFQGAEKTYNFLEANPKVLEILSQDIKSMLS